MKIELSVSAPSQVETECLVAFVLDTDESPKSPDKSKEPEAKPTLQSSDAAIGKVLEPLVASKELTARLFETTLVYAPAGLKAKRLLLIGGGKAKNFTAHELRKCAGTAVRFLKGKNLRSCAIVAPEPWGGEADQSAQSTYVAQRGGADEAVRSVVEGALIGDFDADTYKSDRKDRSFEAITVIGKGDQRSLQTAVERGRIIGESQNFTRTLVNEPGNRMTPTELGNRARQMSQETGLKCEVHSTDKLKELKMGAFWSVSQGSEEPPALIVMRYEPEGVKDGPVLGLVGKGITFDTGGISIKPAEGMEKMKYDMAGGAAMIGAMRAIALLKPKVRVIGIVCAAENMPSGTAQKPGDIQIAMNGKSIEIINTDAEGRLVLADGLHYARQLGATHLVDAATLTGACVVALGMVNAGVFANDEEIFERWAEALKRSGEKFWRLPVDEEYKEMIKSPIADIMNTGGRWGGAITAAMFLKEFVEDTPWIHLDIAGTAWMESDKPWITKGPSGIAVRSLIEFVNGFEPK